MGPNVEVSGELKAAKQSLARSARPKRLGNTLPPRNWQKYGTQRLRAAKDARPQHGEAGSGSAEVKGEPVPVLTHLAKLTSPDEQYAETDCCRQQADETTKPNEVFLGVEWGKRVSLSEHKLRPEREAKESSQSGVEETCEWLRHWKFLICFC